MQGKSASDRFSAERFSTALVILRAVAMGKALAARRRRNGGMTARSSPF
jgi:hypothetical protein